MLPLCTDVLNFIFSTGTEEAGSAVSLFADPLFSFQRSSKARLKNIKTEGDLWTIDEHERCRIVKKKKKMWTGVGQFKNRKKV